jgi:hypothetical protein
MKHFKFIVMALMVAFTFGSFDSANAQVVVRARVGIGTGPYYWHGRHWRHRRAYWRHHHRYYRYY